MKKFSLPSGFSIQQMESEPFWNLIDPYIHKIFDDDSLVFRVRDHLTDPEQESLKSLREHFSIPFKLHLAVMFEDKLAGWAFGYQDSQKSFYMKNSAVLSEFRRKGIYSFLMRATVEKLVDLKFERIWSRHMMTNNSIIIPKLKYGFRISGFELSDIFGTMVHLSYYTNPFHQQVIDFRTGHIRPNKNLKKAFSL